MSYSKRQVRQAWIRRRRRRAKGEQTPSAPVNAVPPVLSGLEYVGQTLTSSAGVWGGYPMPTYQWEFFRAPSTSIQGPGPQNSYTLLAGDETFNIFARVTAINSEGSDNADSNQIGPIKVAVAPSETSAPVISGVGGVGQTLSVSTPAVWNLGEPPATITSTWLRDGVPISGSEDSSTYLTVVADSGATITYQETATNIAGPVVGTASNGIFIDDALVRVTSTGDTRVTSTTDRRIAA